MDKGMAPVGIHESRICRWVKLNACVCMRDTCPKGWAKQRLQQRLVCTKIRAGDGSCREYHMRIRPVAGRLDWVAAPVDLCQIWSLGRIVQTVAFPNKCVS